MVDDDDDDDDDFDERERMPEELWRADFRRAAKFLHDIDVLMMHLSDLMKGDAARHLPEDRQYRLQQVHVRGQTCPKCGNIVRACARAWVGVTRIFCCPCCCIFGQQPEQLHCANCNV